MVGEDDFDRDVADALPQPPPPAPLRRETAIAKAMGEYDANGDTAASVRPDRRPVSRPGGFRNRPQVAGLIAVSLVLVVGVPIAWRELGKGNLATSEPAGVTAIDIAEAPAATMGSRDKSRLVQAGSAPSTMRSGRPSHSIAVPQPAPQMPPPVLAAPAPIAAPGIAVAVAPSDAPARHEESKVAVRPDSEGMAAAAPAASRVAEASGQADMVAAPLRKAAPQAVANALGDVIVTARRARSRGPSYLSTPGDWNACTVDDPRQSLAVCHYHTGPDAHDSTGQAKLFVAEGLTEAWHGEERRAVAAFNQAISVAPNSWQAWLNRGLTRARSGDSAGALADLTQAARLAPHSPRAHYALGRLARARGDERRARSEFGRAAELDPAYAELEE